MEITSTRVKIIKSETRLRGIATITIDNSFVVHDIRIIDGDKGIFAAMPSKKNQNGDFKDTAHPINTETREQIQNCIKKAYQEELKRFQEEEKLEQEN